MKQDLSSKLAEFILKPLMEWWAWMTPFFWRMHHCGMKGTPKIYAGTLGSSRRTSPSFPSGPWHELPRPGQLWIPHRLVQTHQHAEGGPSYTLSIDQPILLRGLNLLANAFYSERRWGLTERRLVETRLNKWTAASRPTNFSQDRLCDWTYCQWVWILNFSLDIFPKKSLKLGMTNFSTICIVDHKKFW